MTGKISSTHTDLSDLLDGQFDTLIADMPDSIRETLAHERNLWHLWDTITPDQRRIGAKQIDDENDPATQEVQQRAFDLVSDIDDIERRKLEREVLPPRIQSDITERDAQIKCLEQEMDEKKSELQTLVSGNHCGQEKVEVSTSSDQISRSATWNDVRIMLYTNQRIGFSISGGEFGTKHLSDIGLFNKRTNGPTSPAIILIGLLEHQEFATSRKATNTERSLMTKLRRSLRELTGMDGDPFFRKAAGWKHRFTLVDRRNAADERAEEKAIHQSFIDDVDYGIVENLGDVETNKFY